MAKKRSTKSKRKRFSRAAFNRNKGKYAASQPRTVKGMERKAYWEDITWPVYRAIHGGRVPVSTLQTCGTKGLMFPTFPRRCYEKGPIAARLRNHRQAYERRNGRTPLGTTSIYAPSLPFRPHVAFQQEVRPTVLPGPPPPLRPRPVLTGPPPLPPRPVNLTASEAALASKRMDSIYSFVRNSSDYDTTDPEIRKAFTRGRRGRLVPRKDGFYDLTNGKVFIPDDGSPPIKIY